MYILDDFSQVAANRKLDCILKADLFCFFFVYYLLRRLSL